MSFLLVLVVVAIATIVFTWPSLILMVLSYWRLIIVLLIPTLVNVAFKKGLGYAFFTTAAAPFGDRIRYRYRNPTGCLQLCCFTLPAIRCSISTCVRRMPW